MRYAKACPKCNGTDIIRVPSVNPTSNMIPVGFSALSAVYVNRYVCCHCGYSEEWIARDDLPSLKKKYGKV